MECTLISTFIKCDTATPLGIAVRICATPWGEGVAGLFYRKRLLQRSNSTKRQER